jgi:hypothetical protein
MRCYRADRPKWCRIVTALDILVFPQSSGGWMAACPKASAARRGPPDPLIIQATGRVVAGESKAADGQMGGDR